MYRATTRNFMGLLVACGLLTSSASGQPVNREDENINAMRKLPQIVQSDQERIGRWVEAELGIFSDFTTFRTHFRAQYTNATNSAPFTLQLAAQTAKVASARFADSNTNKDAAFALAYVLAEIKKIETFDALVAGLKSTDARARMHCAKGLAALARHIAADKAKQDQMIAALRAAGVIENDSVVLGRVYEALAIPGQLSLVFDAYMAIFDVRLERRRRSGGIADGAEVHGLEFFRTPAVSNGLSATQKTQLAGRLAVFLRLDAERYATAGLSFDERDYLERTLDGTEEVLAAMGATGGAVREALKLTGYANGAAVRLEAYKWVGDAASSTNGSLNQAPWNVPVGAP